MTASIAEQHPVLHAIPEKEVHQTPVKESDKSQVLEDCQSTDEGTFASPSSCGSDADASSTRYARRRSAASYEGGSSPLEPSSSCTSDDENHSGQEADVDSSSSSGLNSSCASDDEDFKPLQVSEPIPLAELPSVGSVGHYAGQCSRCCFFPKGRCTNGDACNFCHLDHERVRRKRGGAKKAAAKAAEEAEHASQNPKDEQVAKDPVARKLEFKEESSFVRSSLQAKGEGVIHSMLQSSVTMHALNMNVRQPVVNAAVPIAQPRVPTAQCPRSSAPAAEVLTSKLLAVSSGRPVKVWLPTDVQPLKRLDAHLPAKKKPSFPEYASDKKKTLDPNMPCKKHMPSWLLNLDATSAAAPKPTPKTHAPAPAPQVSSSAVDPAPR